MIGIIKVTAGVNGCFKTVEIEEPKIVQTTDNRLSEIDSKVIEGD